MSDDKKVVDFTTERLKRDFKAGEELHAQGQAFKLYEYAHDADLSVGLTEGNLPVTILFNPETLEGICMSREDAKELGKELLGIADEVIPEDSE